MAEGGEGVGLAPDEPDERIVPRPIPARPAGFRVGFNVEPAEKIEDRLLAEAALAQGADLPPKDGVGQRDGAKLILRWEFGSRREMRRMSHSVETSGTATWDNCRAR